jgi:predicted naringenin-chalcone synthase
MGCHGGFNALRVAKAYAEADREATILIVCVELCSLHFQYSDNPEQIVANSIFADGAAAIVGRSPDHQKASSQFGWQLLDQTSAILPETADQMGWIIGDTGFEMSLSPEVPSLIGNALPDITATFLEKHGLPQNQVTDWAIHPGGPRILSMVEQSLQLNTNALVFSRDVLSQYGNMSSATIFFILETVFVQAHQSLSHGLPDTCVAMAFGPGLTTEIALFQQMP